MTTDRTGWTARERLLDRFSSERTQLGVMLGPALVWLGLFVFLPLAFLVVVSFTTTNEHFQIVWNPTLANYHAIFFEGGAPWNTPFVRSLTISYEIATAVTIMTLVVSFPVSYILARRRGRFFRVTLFFLLVPFFSVYIVRMYAWFTFFGNKGVANNVLIHSGLIQSPLSAFGYGIVPTLIAITHALVPYMLLTLYATLTGVDFTLVDAARDLGAGRLRAFYDVVLPMIGPGVLTGVVFVFIPALGAYLAPLLMGQGKFLMIGQLIVTRVYTQYSIGYGSAIAMFIIVAIVGTVIIIYRVSGAQGLVQL